MSWLALFASVFEGVWGAMCGTYGLMALEGVAECRKQRQGFSHTPSH